MEEGIPLTSPRCLAVNTTCALSPATYLIISQKKLHQCRQALTSFKISSLKILLSVHITARPVKALSTLGLEP